MDHRGHWGLWREIKLNKQLLGVVLPLQIQRVNTDITEKPFISNIRFLTGSYRLIQHTYVPLYTVYYLKSRLVVIRHNTDFQTLIPLLTRGRKLKVEVSHCLVLRKQPACSSLISCIPWPVCSQ